MKLLLDTHVFLWLLSSPERLGEHVGIVTDQSNELTVSAASSWEIAIKHALGRLKLPEDPARYVPSRIRAIGARALPIEHSHALAVATLPPLHRDPFDRMLIAQALAESLTLVSNERLFDRYGVPRLW